MNAIGYPARFLLAAALLAGLALTAGLVRAARQDMPSSAKPDTALLAVLEPYIGGEWHCTGKWSDGRPLEAREIFAWGPGKKWVNVKTFVTGPDGEYQRYEAMYGVKDGRLASWSFTFDGTTDTAEWTVEGKKWSTRKTTKASDGREQTLHQSVELVGPDRFHWLLVMEQGGQKNTIFDGHWERRPASAAAK